MSKGRTFALVTAALVAGLILGSFGLASAATAPAPKTPARGAACGNGLGLGGVMRQAGGTIAEVVAKLTGLSLDEVYALRKDGKSFADIAKTKNVSAEQVTKSVLDARKSALDQAVKDKTITQEQADQAYDRMQDRISTRITSAAPANCDGTGAGGGGFGRGRMGGGCGGGGCGAVAPTQ